MSAFQPGDLIRCIDASGTNLVYRRLYLVVPYQIAVDTAGLVHPALVFVRRNGRAEGYFPERFWPAYPERSVVEMKHKPRARPRPKFEIGQQVRCISPKATAMGLSAGSVYTVAHVRDNGLMRLLECGPKSFFMPWRFEAVPEPFTPYRGSLDEYGPAPEKVDPIFAAIGKVFPTHRADIVRALESGSRLGTGTTFESPRIPGRLR